MIITLNINRIKHGNELWEVFTVFPKNSLVVDPHRAIHFALWYYRNLNSLANRLPIRDIIYNKDNTVFIYDFENIDAPQTQQIKIQYSPVLGEKKCRVCCYERIINQKSFCMMRGVANNKNSHFKCSYWTEDFETLRTGHALHNARRSVEDARTDQRVSGNIRQHNREHKTFRRDNAHSLRAILRQNHLRNDL